LKTIIGTLPDAAVIFYSAFGPIEEVQKEMVW